MQAEGGRAARASLSAQNTRDEKQARRAELSGRALEVLLAPDGRIRRIILAEVLTPVLDALAEGAARYQTRETAPCAPPLQNAPVARNPSDNEDAQSAQSSAQNTDEFFKNYFTHNAAFLVPSPLALEALQAFFSGADLASIRARCAYDDVAPWQYRVMQAMASIERGKVLSYGGLAKRAGHPRAARAVGTACANNPLPLLYPCHRVVQAGGRVGNFMSQQGGALKRRLLEYEGVRFDANGRISAECFGIP